jgi:DNA processing protein
MSSPASEVVRDLLALHLTPGLGPRRTAALLAHFGSAAAVRRAGAAVLARVPGIGPKVAEDAARGLARADVEAELALMERHGVRLLVLGTPDYPAGLATIVDPPHLLYLRGSLTAADAGAVALVGSRHCTDHGRRAAAQLAAGLARAGVTTVSGLARGIDGVVHRETLKAGGRTLAVLAGGLSRIYPPEHADLAREVEAQGGLLSETSMAQEPLAGLFPARNRIISGLCRAVVIVEAAEKSGALITAEHAAEQGRTVLAVPGPFDNPSSGGCHALLRDGAVLCRGVEDILEEVHGLASLGTIPLPRPRERPGQAAPPPPPPSGPPPGLDETQRRVWQLLAGGPRTVDEMAQELRLAAGPLNVLLLGLEMRKVVRRLPGNRYERA